MELALLYNLVIGSPLAVWPATRHVTSWLKNGRHTATDKRTVKPTNPVDIAVHLMG